MTAIVPQPSLHERVISLREEVEALVGTMDVTALPPQKAGELVEVFSKIANLAEVGRARCARRANAGLVHLREGFRSPAAWLASKAGASVGEAIAELSGAEAGELLPALAEALSSGEVSLQKAAVIGAASGEDPVGARELVEMARHEDLRTLKARVEARRAEQESEADLEARHEALRRRRSLRWWRATGGAIRGDFQLAPSDAAPLLARLETLRDRFFEQGRVRGDHEPHEAYAADALCALGSHGEPGPSLASGPGDGDPRVQRGRSSPRAHVLLRVDVSALARRRREGDEVCEIAGVGTVPLSTARDLLGDAVVDLVVRRGVEVVSVTSLGRTVPRAVRIALMDRDPTCVVPGCEATQLLEIDHWRVDFARGGPTALDNLARLCIFHHRLKTHRGWRLLGGPGAWRWVPPSDRASVGRHWPAADGGQSLQTAVPGRNGPRRATDARPVGGTRPNAGDAHARSG